MFTLIKHKSLCLLAAEIYVSTAFLDFYSKVFILVDVFSLTG
jgi:hypothetical protein